MRRVWAVVRREFVERVRKKSFWVMALLGPLFFAAVFLMPLLMSRGGGVKRLALVDRTTTTLGAVVAARLDSTQRFLDRKSTRLNSSHGSISYAVFCLKKKKKKQNGTPIVDNTNGPRRC